jgi:precorrin-6A/cobalt-precorrin-6A reductase
MNGQIWLIGGTSDSVTIAKMLFAHNISFVVTVTTKEACSLYDTNQIVVGKMDRPEMKGFCQKYQIQAVVDASHPYAVEVSHLAIAVSADFDIPYLRYERVEEKLATAMQANSQIIELDSFTSLLAGDYLQNQRVLLTIGCKALPLFKTWQDKAALFARVLPKVTSLQTALAAGFTSDRLIAIRPPINIALETALWQQWQISLIVTKASGKAGGEDIKRQVAAKLNIPAIVITRPQVVYPKQTSIFEEVLAFCM